MTNVRAWVVQWNTTVINNQVSVQITKYVNQLSPSKKTGNVSPANTQKIAMKTSVMSQALTALSKRVCMRYICNNPVYEVYCHLDFET